MNFEISMQDKNGPFKLFYNTHTSEMYKEDGTPFESNAFGPSDALDNLELPTYEKFEPYDMNNPPGKESSKLTELKISMGLKCNYSCQYCSQATHLNDTTHTNMADARGFIENLTTWWEGGPNGDGTDCKIEFWGGEPTLYIKKMRYLAESIRERYPNVKYHVFSNGSLLPDKTIQWLYDMGFTVTISHDGPGHSTTRGPDPFDDPESKAQLIKLYKKFHPEGRMNFNAVLTMMHHSFTDLKDFIEERIGGPAVISTEEMLMPYDVMGQMCSPQTPEDHRQLYKDLVHELIHKDGFSNTSVWMKCSNFESSIQNKRPIWSMSQKCGMDRSDVAAVDLQGHVYTCQNSISEPHKIGHVEDLDGVKLTTSTHFMMRDNCSKCPVVQLCQGSCMFVHDEMFEKGCANSYTYNSAMMAGALYHMTRGGVLLGIKPVEEAVQET